MTVPDDIFRNQVRPKKKKWKGGGGEGELKHISVCQKVRAETYSSS